MSLMEKILWAVLFILVFIMGWWFVTTHGASAVI